jgi:hypothetical protein
MTFKGRPAIDPDQRRSVCVAVRFTPDGARILDEMRGEIPRSVYLRQLLRDAYRRRTE